MANKLVIHKNADEIQIAVLNEKQELVQLQKESLSDKNKIQVGDIFLGRVKRVLPSLNAAFVEINHPKEGFLYYLDLGNFIKNQIKYFNVLLNSKQYKPIEELELKDEAPKEGNIKDYLKPGQVLPVRVIKEPISNKGARLSASLSFAGNYLVFIPFSKGVMISRKIEDNSKKKYFRKVLEGTIHKNIGIIVRTAAAQTDIDTLVREYESLYHKWEKFCFSVIKADRTKIPVKIYSENTRAISFLRDILSLDVSEILIDDEDIYNELKSYLVKSRPEWLNKVSYKKTKQGLFMDLGIDKKIQKSFGKYVSFGQGSYLIIEKTEALHTIDINSGKFRNKLLKPEEAALEVNLKATEEIAKQLKLRDLGGIIVIDFIDQREEQNRKKVVEELKKHLQQDKAKINVLPMSKFGLVQITRERVRPEVKIENEKKCPYCKGTGTLMEPEISVIDKIIEAVKKSPKKNLTLRVHPFVKAYLANSPFKFKLKWLFKQNKWVKILEDSSLTVLEFSLS